MYQFHHTRGSQNVSGVSTARIDQLLDQARQATALAAEAGVQPGDPAHPPAAGSIIYLWHPQNFTGQIRTVRNVVLFGDGLLRLKTAGFTQGLAPRPIVRRGRGCWPASSCAGLGLR